VLLDEAKAKNGNNSQMKEIFRMFKEYFTFKLYQIYNKKHRRDLPYGVFLLVDY